MDYTTLFYWLTVADNARLLFGWGAGIFTASAVISTVINFIAGAQPDTDTDAKAAQRISRKWMWWSFPFAFLWWALLVLTPSKKDALLIVAGGQTLNFLTTDKAAKEIPHELSQFVVTELKNMASEAKVNLNIKENKNKILEEVKNMTPKEILERAKTDTIFARIISE